MIHEIVEINKYKTKTPKKTLIYRSFSISSIICGTTLRKCLMYFMHVFTVTVFQNFSIPSTNSFLLLGIISLRINSLGSCHDFQWDWNPGILEEFPNNSHRSLP